MAEIESIMSKGVISINRDQPVRDAIRVLLCNDITGLPVVDDDGVMVGIITEKDVLVLLSGLHNMDENVELYMTKEVVSFDVESKLTDICDCLRENNFRRIPILKNNKPVGIVSRRDLVEHILTFGN